MQKLPRDIEDNVLAITKNVFLTRIMAKQHEISQLVEKVHFLQNHKLEVVKVITDKNSHFMITQIKRYKCLTP